MSRRTQGKTNSSSQPGHSAADRFPLLTVQNVSGGYHSAETILHQISFDVSQGEFFALLGPNGSGKTTLMKMITGAMPVKTGAIHIAGKPLHAYSALERARLIAVLGQEEQITFDFTVEEIVALGRYPHQKGLFKLLTEEDYKVMDEAMSLTQVSHYRDTPYRQLSGGEKQRVLLAKAIAQQPKLLLLDEPTNHLDLHHAFQLLSLLKEWQSTRQLTILAILHDLNMAALYADHAALLDQGRLERIGGPELLRDKELIDRIYKISMSPVAHPLVAKSQLFLNPRSSTDESGTTGGKPVRNRILAEAERLEKSFVFPCRYPVKWLSDSDYGTGEQWVKAIAIVPQDEAGTLLVPEALALGSTKPTGEACQAGLAGFDSSQTALLAVSSAAAKPVMEFYTEPVPFAVVAIADREKIHLFIVIDGYLGEEERLQLLLAAERTRTREKESDKKQAWSRTSPSGTERLFEAEDVGSCPEQLAIASTQAQHSTTYLQSSGQRPLPVSRGVRASLPQIERHIASVIRAALNQITYLEK